MLVIRRRERESIMIGGEIAVEILEITPSRVKLGVTAPHHVSVLRGEIPLSVDENLKAAASRPDLGAANLAALLGGGTVETKS